jgi:Polyketide cyclase / dehydrase and lipid transport
LDFSLSIQRFDDGSALIRNLGERPPHASARLVDGERSMILVDLRHTFPVSVGDAFEYITDTRNWKVFFPHFVRLHDPAHAKWDTLGDRVTVVIRLLGRDVQVDMTLEQYEKDGRVAYVSRQQGLPDAKHERHFRAVPEGFEFRPVVVFEPRSGLAGLFDRLLVKRAVAGALRKTIENLEAVFETQRPPV